MDLSSTSLKSQTNHVEAKKRKRNLFLLDIQVFLNGEKQNIVSKLQECFFTLKQQFDLLFEQSYEVFILTKSSFSNKEDIENFCLSLQKENIQVIEIDDSSIIDEQDEPKDSKKLLQQALKLEYKEEINKIYFLTDVKGNEMELKKLLKKFRNLIKIMSLKTFTKEEDFQTLISADKKKNKFLSIKKKKKILPSKISDNMAESTNPIMAMLDKIEKTQQEIVKLFNDQLDSLCESTSNLEITSIPPANTKKRSVLNAMDDENDTILERIFKKPKLNSLLEYNFPTTKNMYLENMLKLNVENCVLNEVSLCEETTISEKEPATIIRNERNTLYIYKSNIPNEKQVCIEITKSDLDRVTDNLLNDTIILFYLKFIQNELIDESKRNKTYIFNTYFYQKFFMSLNNMIVNQLSDKDYEKGYSAIKNWTKNTDLFDKDFVFIPIHDDLQKHWCLFLVVYPNLLYKKIMNLEDKYEEKNIDIHAKPMILYFDSFGPLDKNLAIPIRKYLELEFKNKKKADFEKIQSVWHGIDEKLLPCYQPLTLFQDNLKDCGIFVLEYTESFLNNPEYILAKIEENNNRLRWFPKKIIKMKRMQIRKIVLDLAKGEEMKSVVEKYLKERNDILKNADEKDYDHIDMAEFRNYLNGCGVEFNHLTDLEKQEHLVKFYNSKVQASLT